MQTEFNFSIDQIKAWSKSIMLLFFPVSFESPGLRQLLKLFSTCFRVFMVTNNLNFRRILKNFLI